MMSPNYWKLSQMEEEPAFQGFKKWVLATYGDGSKTKTITTRKYNRIYRILSGKCMGENAKFKFWVKSKGFCLLPCPQRKCRISEIGGNIIALPNKKTSVERKYKRVAVVEEFFDIIYDVHVHSEANGGKHAGQKRTYRMIIESYAFLPREAVTHFLMCCAQCKIRMQLNECNNEMNQSLASSGGDISLNSPLSNADVLLNQTMTSTDSAVTESTVSINCATDNMDRNSSSTTEVSVETEVKTENSPNTTCPPAVSPNEESRKRKLSDSERQERCSTASHDQLSPKKSSDEAEEDDEEDEEEKMSASGSDIDPERLKAFNMFCRLFVDENLDRMVPISKQPKDKVQSILDACDRQFPEFHERSRKRIRTYLKSCRRMRRAKEMSGWDSFRPTPPHLTSAIAESMLARACENETQNAKRIRMGLGPLAAVSSSPAKSTSTSHTNATPSKTLPNPMTTVAQMSMPPGSAQMSQPPKMFPDWRFPGVAAAQPFRPDLSPFFTNGLFRPSFPAFHSPLPGAAAMALQASQAASQMALHNNVAAEMSTKKTTTPAPGKGTALSSNEITAIRQLISGYRESATFLYRSADDMEQLIVNLNNSSN